MANKKFDLRFHELLLRLTEKEIGLAPEGSDLRELFEQQADRLSRAIAEHRAGLKPKKKEDPDGITN